MKERTYIAIDLKSFYASVECRERGLDPLDTNLVVADESRTDKTICLAVTPSLKSKRPTPDGSTTRQDTNWMVPPASILNFLKTQTLRLISLSPRLGWLITWNTAPGFIMSI